MKWWCQHLFSFPQCFIVPSFFFLCSSSSGTDWISAMWYQQPAQVHRPAHQSDAPQNQQNQQGKHKEQAVNSERGSCPTCQVFRSRLWVTTVYFPGEEQTARKSLVVCTDGFVFIRWIFCSKFTLSSGEKFVTGAPAVRQTCMFNGDSWKQTSGWNRH